MLKLERMNISGFKSFGDATEVRFREGVTAIVGPNGCGKSNIGDAINWVLGEQNAKMMRGASMQDVIFNGSEARKAQGMAEVSLCLASSNGAGEEQGNETVITRRLFRSGESEYLLNGARTRLRDIQDFLREARIGAQTYATIEQGRIDQILNAKPKERRLIIEEAAGIAGFKHKRRLAELKFEATQANLLRVSDIVTEVERQINSLKRQAAKARRYQRLRDEFRAKERIRFGSQARAMESELLRLREAERRAGDAEAAVAARLGVVEASLTAERQAVDEAETELRVAGESLHRLEIEVNRGEAQGRTCTERISEAEEALARLAAEDEALTARRHGLEADLQSTASVIEESSRELAELSSRHSAGKSDHEEATRRHAIQREIVEALRQGLFDVLSRAADCRNRERLAEEAIERIGRERGKVEGERDQARVDLERLEAEASSLRKSVREQRRKIEGLGADLVLGEARLRDSRARQAALSAALVDAREQEKSAGSCLRTLDDVATRFAGVSDGVRMLLSAGPAAGVRTHGVVADFVEASRDVEGAAELYLQRLLPAVIVDDDADVRRAAVLLRSEGAGRTHFFSRNHPSGVVAVGTGRAGEERLPDTLMADSRVLGRLRDRLSVSMSESTNGFVRDRIDDAILVDSLESALALHREYPNVDYLTPSGEVVYSSGLVAAGGPHSSDQGLLAHRRRTQEARGHLEAAAVRAAEFHARVEEGLVEQARFEAEIDAKRQPIEEARRIGMELELNGQRSADEQERMVRRARVLADELLALDGERERLILELALATDVLHRADEAQREAERSLHAGISLLDGIESQVREGGEAGAVLRAEIAARTQRQAAFVRDGERQREVLAEIDSRRAAAHLDAEAARERSRGATELLAQTEAEVLGYLEERSVQVIVTAEKRRAIAERRQTREKDEGVLRSLKAELETSREEARSTELLRIRAEADRRHLDDLCVQELGCTAAEAEAGAGDALDNADLVAIDAQLVDLKEEIEKIGPVNLTAIEEFAGLEERHAFLVAQWKDLEASMASLRETIKRINRSSRERFLAVFETVRISYQEIFRILFNGGRADLILDESEDVLECGIEILAQPPGKRLGNVSLLSGGEKSMSAIALLFAIFRNQPSPFCLLDEVDAALDDVNVNRFTRMLQEYAANTQFILITHNKRSMESAQLLYGVTMDEPGVSKLISLKL